MAEHTIKDTLETTSEYMGSQIRGALSSKEDEFRVDELPTPSASIEGEIYQYMGDSTVNYQHGFFYECVALGTSPETYGWQVTNVQPTEEVQTIQVDELPNASSEIEGDIYQYVGGTTANYTHGYFYECKAQGTNPETYAWENVDVQAGGGGADPRINEEITEVGVRFDDGFRPYIKLNIEDIIPPFTDVSWDDINDITELYYEGILTLNDIKSAWSMGDSKTISLMATNSNAAQDVTLKIIDFDHDILTNPINGKTNALLTFGFVLAETSAFGSEPWISNALRTKCNEDYLNALPSGLKSLIKPVNKQTDNGASDLSTVNTTSDKLFLCSAIEFTGDTSVPSRSYHSYLQYGAGGGTQYNYYKTVDNRKFGKDCWTTTNDSYYHSGVGKRNYDYHIYLTTDGKRYDAVNSSTLGIVPHGCI